MKLLKSSPDATITTEGWQSSIRADSTCLNALADSSMKSPNDLAKGSLKAITKE
jgi:hypothetical protein